WTDLEKMLVVVDDAKVSWRNITQHSADYAITGHGGHPSGATLPARSPAASAATAAASAPTGEPAAAREPRPATRPGRRSGDGGIGERREGLHSGTKALRIGPERARRITAVPGGVRHRVSLSRE